MSNQTKNNLMSLSEIEDYALLLKNIRDLDKFIEKEYNNMIVGNNSNKWNDFKSIISEYPETGETYNFLQTVCNGNVTAIFQNKYSSVKNGNDKLTLNEFMKALRYLHIRVI